MTMRIGIDAHMLGSRETGNETYVRNLLRSLATIDSENQYISYLLNRNAVSDLDLGSNFSQRQMRLVPSIVRIPLALPLAARRDRLDLLHVTYIAPPICSCPTVVTVHDISYEFFPEAFSLRDRIILSSFVPGSARRAARVIAVSEQTRDDLVRVYKLDPARIRVIYEAPASMYRRLSDRAQIRRVLDRYGIMRDYILAVGNLQPRKNLPRLISAYDALRRRGEIQHLLVIVGQAGWHGDEVLGSALKSPWGRDIVFPGFVPDADLVELYNGAAAFVYPSLYEGFGLPLLEAMACGTPVICSNVASLPEVAGDAAIQVDPTDVAGLAGAIRGLLGNSSLAAELGMRGAARAAQFSWERTARETLAGYGEATRAPLIRDKK